MKRSCGACPHDTTTVSDSAISVVHALQAAKIGKSVIDRDAVEAGCPWYLNSEEHSYCFWNLNAELHNSPMTDKEIMNMLLMSRDELDSTYRSAIAKLYANRNNEEIREFLEIIQERINTMTDLDSNSVYMPSNFREKISEMELEDAQEKEKEDAANPKQGRGRPKKLKTNNLPLHRDGRKVDLYSLGSPKARK